MYGSELLTRFIVNDSEDTDDSAASGHHGCASEEANLWTFGDEGVAAEPPILNSTIRLTINKQSNNTNLVCVQHDEDFGSQQGMGSDAFCAINACKAVALLNLEKLQVGDDETDGGTSCLKLALSIADEVIASGLLGSSPFRVESVKRRHTFVLIVWVERRQVNKSRVTTWRVRRVNDVVATLQKFPLATYDNVGI